MTEQSKPSGRAGTVLVVGIAVVAVVALGAIGVVPRLAQRDALARAEAQNNAPRPVRVAKIVAGPPKIEITLPATAAPLFATTLYAKSVGFLRRNLVDVGDHVKRGQLLAEIDAAETEQDLALARAQLDEAAANVGLVQRTADRSRQLAEVGVVSRDAADQTRAQANSAVASLRSRRAAVKRVTALRKYQRVEAPFDGVITRRSYDPGALVGGAGQGGAALFELAQTRTLRVFIDVPQSMAAGIAPGVDAAVFVPSAPTALVAGKVIRTSGVLDASTRTLRVEVNIPGDGRILPGSFVYVRLTVPRKSTPPLLPGAAMVVRKEGPLIARLDGNVVHLVPVQVGRDLGKEVELLGGAKPGELVVLNPPDDLLDGAVVRVVESKPVEGSKPADAGKPAGGKADGAH